MPNPPPRQADFFHYDNRQDGSSELLAAHVSVWGRSAISFLEYSQQVFGEGGNTRNDFLGIFAASFPRAVLTLLS